MSPLDEARAQVHVEEVKRGVSGKEQVGAQASASFPMTPGKVVITADLHGKPAEGHIAVASSVKGAVLPETVVMRGQFGGDRASLVEFRATIPHVQNFLQRHNIGVESRNDFSDALRIGTPIQA